MIHLSVKYVISFSSLQFIHTFLAKLHRLALILVLLLWGITPAVQAAERELHWDALDVDARLEANGVLDVIEHHTMVFTGDWNGGERIFNVRQRQKFEFLGLERVDANTGALLPLHETSGAADVDEFTWAGPRTLRWRSRRPSDPPFASTRLTYVLHYKLSGILLKDEEQYRIDHDFAFPDRAGSIARFSLGLVLDPSWRPLVDMKARYTSGPLAPGQSFVLTIPLRYSGPDVPAAIDIRRPPKIVWAVAAIFGVFSLIVLGFVARERALGRFARIEKTDIDNTWIEEHILSHPAEVVGAAWDGRIGTPEVVALIARMTAEGKLESDVEGKDSMTLHLKVERSTLDGHERALVDGLFFNHRTETNTKAVQQHYKSKGFNPVTAITPQLAKHVKTVLPSGDVRVGRLAGITLILTAALLLTWSVYSEPELGGGAVAAAIGFLILGAILQIPGWLFRTRMDWGLREAALFTIPAFAVCSGTAALLWWGSGNGQGELPWTMIGALSALVLCVANASINGMKSRQSRDAIAFRKRLAAGRNFFMKELENPKPDLRDSWYPWLLAFGLGKQVDVWSTRHASTTTPQSSTWDSSTSSSSSASPTHTGFTGGGGLSGGAGASGAWAAAATGMAAGVSAPSSSSSDNGGGSSSSSGSSGGGGGGGW